jgi:hypothetical protein
MIGGAHHKNSKKPYSQIFVNWFPYRFTTQKGYQFKKCNEYEHFIYVKGISGIIK